jgi:hypothetical protein
LAVIVVFGAYLTLAFSFWLYDTDYRFWVFAIKPMSALHFGIFLGYIIPFIIYFLVASLVLHGQFRSNTKAWKEMVANIILMIIPYIVFLAFQYIPLFGGKTLAIPELHLASIVMFQFIPIFIIVAMVSTYFYRKTGHIYVGAFINAMVVTWVIVAGQATHYPF